MNIILMLRDKQNKKIPLMTFNEPQFLIKIDAFKKKIINVQEREEIVFSK